MGFIGSTCTALPRETAHMVAQIATGEKCDLVSGSYIRGAFELALAENSTNSSARVLEVGRCRLTL